MSNDSTDELTRDIAGLYAVARAEVEAVGEACRRLEALGATVGGKARAEARQAVEAALQGVPVAVESIEGAALQARQALHSVNRLVVAVAFLIGLVIGAGGVLGLAYHTLLTPQLDALAVGQDAIQQMLKDAHAAPTHGGVNGGRGKR